MRKDRDSRQHSRSRTNQIFDALIILGITVLLDLLLFGALGKAGNVVKDFLIGIFGFSIYGFGVAMLIVSTLMLLGMRRKLQTKIVLIYVAILICVVCMCHLATSQSYASLKYSAYLDYCFKSSGATGNYIGTAGGAAAGVFLYPLAKLYIFSMVMFGLVIAGLIALAIVLQLNRDLSAYSFKREKKVKNRLDNVIMEDSEVGYIETADTREMRATNSARELEPQKKLYNGTATGHTLSNDFGKKANKPMEYTPIDNMHKLTNDEEIYENSPSEVILNPKEIEDEVERTQRIALEYLYGKDGDKPNANDYFVSPEIKGSRFSKSAEKKDKNKANDGKIYEIDPKYRAYSSNYRREEIERKRKSLFGNNDIEETSGNNEENSVSDSFCDDIETTLNRHLQENKLNLKDVFDESDDKNRASRNSDASAYSNDLNENKNSSTYEKNRTNSEPSDINKSKFVDDGEVEDLTEKRQSPSILDHIKKLNKQKEQAEFDNLFETPKSVNYDQNGGRRGTNGDNKGTNYNNNNGTNSDNNGVNFNDRKSGNYTDNKGTSQQGDSPKSEFDSYKSQAFGIDKTPPKRRMTSYIPPSIDCLKDYNEYVEDTIDIEEKARILESKMADCGIEIKTENIVRGPRFSRIEFSTTTQISKISARERDISMWMSAKSLRVLTPIPGTPYCGVEIPNVNRGVVGMKNIVNSPEFNNTKKGSVSFALGKDIDGNNYVANVCEFPHGLVAGATGAGKSVCLNAMICSILFKYSPEEVRLVLVDPKKVEFSMYRGIPHLLIPNILTEDKEVISALKWAVKEMEARYDAMDRSEVTNIKQYNEKLTSKECKFPYIVVIVDEVGDIIQSPIGKEFELLVKKLSAKARASGIHLILATQRPTVDVITGTIKANCPTRIAFAVAQSVDSFSILDLPGAEKLLRFGDMLYKDSSGSPLARVQGCFIDTSEVSAIVKQVKERNEAIYDDSITEAIMKAAEPDVVVLDRKMSSLPDELCLEVLELCLERKKVSITLFQRVFQLGFPRAGKIIDWLMNIGAIKEEGNQKIFILTREQVDEIIKRESGEENDV